MKNELIDLSFKIESEMPTCGTAWHQRVDICPMGTIESVGRNTHRIVIGSHSGTHMDAPFHFIQSGETIDEMDIELMCGEIELIDFRNFTAGSVVLIEDVKKIRISKRMLFVFGWYHYWKTDQYYDGFPYFSEEAIDYLVANGMSFMALDTPSPDSGKAIFQSENDSPNHKKLLQKEVVIVEYLCNTDILDFSKKYEIFALPLKVAGADGAPARVLVREI